MKTIKRVVAREWFHPLLYGDKGKKILLRKGEEPVLFEFHAGVYMAKVLNQQVSHFRQELIGASHKTDIDAIIGDKHIQASLARIPDSIVNEKKEEFG